MDSQRDIIQQIISGEGKTQKMDIGLSKLVSQMRKTEDEVQDSRSILAQLRLRGEQRIAKSKRSQSPTKPENSVIQADTDDNDENEAHKMLNAEDSGNGNRSSEMPSMSSSPRASISSSSSCSSTPNHVTSNNNFCLLSYGGHNSSFGVHPNDNAVSLTPDMSFGQLGDQVSEMMLGPQATMFTSPSCGQYSPQDISSFMFAHGQPQHYSLPNQPSPTRLQDADLVAAVHALHNGQEVWYC
jgi:hypothetical protein